jgi:hypothetical protein
MAVACTASRKTRQVIFLQDLTILCAIPLPYAGCVMRDCWQIPVVHFSNSQKVRLSGDYQPANRESLTFFVITGCVFPQERHLS